MNKPYVLDEFLNRHFVSVDEARVCYSKAGAGPALVFFHGYPLSGLTWRYLIPSLAERFTCYAFDLIGLGDSTSRNPADFSSQGQGKIFQRALAALGVPVYAVIGNDSGGWIARELALLEPTRITHLILTNTEIPNHRPPWVGFYQGLARLPGSSSLFRLMLASRLWRHSRMGFGGCFENLDLIEGDFAKKFISPLLASHERMARARRFLVSMKFSRMDEFSQLHGKLPMPVAFVWGAADPTFPIQHARAMTTQFPNVAKFLTIAKGKLFLQEEFPDLVAQPIIEFLSAAVW